jgi:hypothetical protein
MFEAVLSLMGRGQTVVFDVACPDVLATKQNVIHVGFSGSPFGSDIRGNGCLHRLALIPVALSQIKMIARRMD